MAPVRSLCAKHEASPYRWKIVGKKGRELLHLLRPGEVLLQRKNRGKQVWTMSLKNQSKCRRKVPKTLNTPEKKGLEAKGALSEKTRDTRPRGKFPRILAPHVSTGGWSQRTKGVKRNGKRRKKARGGNVLPRGGEA